MIEVRRKIIKVFLHFLMILVYRIKIIGKENIPKSGRYILCGNHVHAMDSPAIALTAKRKIRFVAKEELYKNKFVKFLADTFGVIKIRRDSADLDAIKEILKGLKNGDIIAIYPEGTRNGMEKHKNLKTGAAYMALKTDTQVIPVGINGTFKPFSKITLNYGKPMDFSKYKNNEKDKEVQEKVTKEIMNEVVRLSKI